MGYSNANIRFSGSVSGDVTTVGPNEEIDFDPQTVGALTFEAVTNLTMKLNDESTEHVFLAGDKFTYEGIAIKKLTITDTASQIKYKGLTV